MEGAGGGLSKALLQGGVGCAASQAVLVQPAGVPGICQATHAWQLVLKSIPTCIYLIDAITLH